MKKFLVMVLVFQFLTIPLYPVLQVSEVYAQPVRDQYYKEEPQQPVYEPEPEPEPEYQAPNVEENITPTYYPPARRYDPPPVYEPEYEPEPEWVPEQEEAPAAETEQPGGQEAATPAVKTAYQVCLEENPGSGYCDAIFYGIGQPANEPGVFNEGSPAVAETSGGNSGSWWDTVTQWPADAWEWAKDTAEETGQSIAEVVAGTGDRIADMFGGGDEETASDSNSETPSVGPQPQDPEWAGKIAAAQAEWDNYKNQALAEDPEAAAQTRERLVASLGLDAGIGDEQILASLNSGADGLNFSGTPPDITVEVAEPSECQVEGGCLAASGDEAPRFDLLYTLTNIPGPFEMGVRLADGFLTNGIGGIGLDYSASVAAENNVESVEKQLGILKKLKESGVTSHLSSDGSVDHAKAGQEYLKLFPESAAEIQPYLSAVSEADKKDEALRESSLSFATGGGSDGIASAIESGQEWKSTAVNLDQLVFNKPEVWAVLREDPSIYVPGDPDGNIDLAALARATRRYYQTEGSESGLRLANTTVESAEKAEKSHTEGVAQVGALALTLMMGGASGGVAGALANVYLPFGVDDAVTGAINSRNASRVADAVGDVVPQRAPGPEAVSVREIAEVQARPQEVAPVEEYSWFDPRRWIGMKPQEEIPVTRLDEPEQVAQGLAPDPVRVGEPKVPATRVEEPEVEAPASRAQEPVREAEVPAPNRAVDPTQIADAPTPIRPEVPDTAKAELPCAAALPSYFQLVREVYAQDGGGKPCNPLDPRDWGDIVNGWLGRNQPARIPDSPTKNQTDELAQIEPVDLDPSPAGPIADIPDQASGIGTRAEGPVIADKPLVTFQDDFAARLKEKFPDGGDVEIGPPRPYSEGSSDTYISKNEGQVLLWTADQSDGGLPPIVKNVSSTAPRGSKAGTQVVDAWEQTMADKGYRVVGANNVETRIPQGQSAVRVQDGDKVLELTPAEAFWWGRGYRPYLEGERNSNKLWVKPLTPEGQESIDIARRLAQQSNNPYVDFTRYLDSTPKLSESKVADEVVAQLSPSSTHDEIRVVLAEKGYLDREADELAYQVRQRLAESNSGSRADVLGLERNEITQVAGPDTPGIKPAVQAPASQFDEYGQLIVPQRSWWEDAVSRVRGLTSYAGDAIENGWWRQGILARMFGEQDTSQITPKLENLRTRLGQSREVRVDENGKLVFDPPSTPAVPGTNQADELAGRADAPGAGGVEPDSQAGRAGPDAPAPKDEPPLLPCNISIRDWAGPNVLGTSRGPQVLAVTNGGAPCPVRAAVGAVLDGPVGGAVPLAWRASLESTASLIDGLVRRSQELGNSFMNRVRGNSSGPTRVQGVRGNKAFEAVLETYGNKPGVTEDLFPRYDDGTGGKTMVNLKPGDAGHLLSAKYPDSERIILLTPGEVLKLEEGKHYNYIITSDKRIFIIERRNGMEIGEKHQQLAGELWKLDKVTAEAIANKNVGVVMAGEARIENGALLMDLQSGTFSRISDNKGFKGVWASGQGELSNLEDVVEGVTGIRPLAVRQVDVRKRNAVEFELDKEAAAKRSIDAPVGSSNRLVALNNRMQEWIDDHPNATKTIVGVSLGVSAGVVLGVPFVVAFGRSGSAAPRLSSTAIPATSNTADETDRSGDEETTANASNQMGQIPSNSNVDPFLPSSQDLDGKVSVVPVSKNPSAESAKKVDDIMDDFKNIVPKESRVPACAGLDSVLANIWEDGRYDIIKNYGQVPGECLNPLPDGSQCEKGKVVNNTYTQCGGSIGLENQEFGVNYDITRTIRCEESNGKIEARIAYSEPKVSSEKGVCQEKSEQKYSRDLGESCSFDAECKGLAECDSQVKVCRQRGEIRKYENGLDSKGYDDCVGLAATMKAQKNPVRGIEYACHQDNKNSGFNNKRVQIYVMDSEALNICMIKILDLGQGVNCPKP